MAIDGSNSRGSGRLVKVTLCAILLLGSLSMAGCTIVEIDSARAEPRLSIWPLGVSVKAADNAPLTISGRSFGLGGGCQTAALGYADFSCTYIDPLTCGVAIIQNPSPETESTWAKIARKTEAHCLHGDSK